MSKVEVDLDGTNEELSKLLDKRAKLLILNNFTMRGKFTLLERLSGVSAYQWKNFYYERQGANEAMLAFLSKQFPHDAEWLRTGEIEKQDGGFFALALPTLEQAANIGDRFLYVLRAWVGPQDDQLAEYMAGRSTLPGGDQAMAIPAREWRPVIRRQKEPSTAMISVVCRQFPELAQWLVLGNVDPVPQRILSNPTANDEWIAARQKERTEASRRAKAVFAKRTKTAPVKTPNTQR